MKLRYTYKTLLLVLIIAATWSCEPDDICAEATQTTPQLIIRFYDIIEPEDFKSVRELTIRGFNSEGIELANIPVTASDSIVLPLRFQGDGEAVISRFILEKDSDLSESGGSNIDTINVSYIPEFQYVSRACGYKSIFTNLFISIEPDDNNWILTNQILTTTIENENEAHIILRH